MPKSVICELLDALKYLGIKDIFGVPGDYAFPIDNAVEADNDLRWIGCCNELNAGYAADGYARIHGISALCTTFGVGELSAAGAIAGAFAERLPIIHLVGMPATGRKPSHRVMHHTLGTGDFGVYVKMFAPISTAQTILTPANACSELRRVLHAALYERRPVYIGIPQDCANATAAAGPVFQPEEPHPYCASSRLEAALDAAAEKINRAQNPVVLPGYLLRHWNMLEHLNAILEQGNLPFATMVMDKCVWDESSPRYLGLYDGIVGSDAVRQRVESSDCVINLGALLSDFNTGGFTAKLKCGNLIQAGPHEVSVGPDRYLEVELIDFIRELPARLTPHSTYGVPLHEPEISRKMDARGYIDDFFRRLRDFLEEGDIVAVDTGCSTLATIDLRFPAECVYLNQTLWGAIGWATPAAFGAALAAPRRRTLLLTGEGAFQMTAQEICRFEQYHLKPLIFVINNQGYQIERILDANPNHAYNDLAEWNYPALAASLCHARILTDRITGPESAKRVFGRLKNQPDAGAFIEVVTDKKDLPEMAIRFREIRDHLYRG